MKGKMKVCKKSGGSVKMVDGAKHHKKEGEMKSMKAKKADGGGVMKRLDKKSRGKLATVSSPLSGAEPAGLPGGGKQKTTTDKENN